MLRFVRQFMHPLIYVLLGAGVVTLVLGELVDTSVILAVILVNAFIGFAQESKADGRARRVASDGGHGHEGAS